jgi:hypothetical protein
MDILEKETCESNTEVSMRQTGIIRCPHPPVSLLSFLSGLDGELELAS